MDLRRTIILLMAIACVMTSAGIIHCHVNERQPTKMSAFGMAYSILFPILFTMTSFFLVEQLMIGDGTAAPWNRLRTIYALTASVALFYFGLKAAILASERTPSLEDVTDYHDAVIAAVIAFISMAVYLVEGLARYRKNRLI